MEDQSMIGLVARNHGRPKTTGVEGWSVVRSRDRVCEDESEKIRGSSRHFVIKPLVAGLPSKRHREIG
jgi:hypothetical protein